MKIKLHWQILLAFILALLSYYFLGEKILFMSYFGVIFISLLKMIIIPLIFLSVVSGVSSLGTTRKISRIGTKTLLYYFTTSMIAITIGLVLTNIIQPGNTVQISSNIEPFDVSRLSKPDSLFDIVIRMIPTNIFNSLSNGNILPIIFFSIVFGIGLLKLSESKKSNLFPIINEMFEIVTLITNFKNRFQFKLIVFAKKKKYCTGQQSVT